MQLYILGLSRPVWFCLFQASNYWTRRPCPGGCCAVDLLRFVEQRRPASRWNKRGRLFGPMFVLFRRDTWRLHLLGCVCKIAKSAHFLRLVSICPSAWNNSAPTGRSFMKFDIWGFLENLLGKFKFHQNQGRVNGTLRGDQYTFLIISLLFLLRMKKCFRQKL